jgi:hypothetical protein
MFRLSNIEPVFLRVDQDSHTTKRQETRIVAVFADIMWKDERSFLIVISSTPSLAVQFRLFRNRFFYSFISSPSSTCSYKVPQTIFSRIETFASRKLEARDLLAKYMLQKNSVTKNLFYDTNSAVRLVLLCSNVKTASL